jgi:hypothetical protein
MGVFFSLGTVYKGRLPEGRVKNSNEEKRLERGEGLDLSIQMLQDVLRTAPS